MTNIFPLDRRRDVRIMQMVCFALGRSTSGAAFEQLVDQLQEARRQRDEAFERFTTEYERFTAKMEALHAELAQERAKRAQLQALTEWPHDHARMQ
jgi:hypothetical protein